ncbi:MAG: DUF86 domain-containing protein [bacterium]
MTAKDDTVYLKHILDAIAKIEEYAAKTDPSKFLKDSLIQDGIIRQIEIIGEATKNISTAFREKHKDIVWKDIAGMRDKLIHGYFGVDLNAVWDTTTKDIPKLKTSVAQLLK